MKVTYIYHSGYAVELEHHIFLMDYYKGELPEFDKEKELIVCASHFHQDHFSREILRLQDKYPKTRYILAADIRRKIPKGEQNERMVFLKKRDFYEAEDFTVGALRSTDEGSAFLITCEGKRIYHAGDLNWWHWEEESDKYNQFMKRAYQKEIEELADVPIDVAFVVLDPRQGEPFYWGFDWFMRHTDTRYAFPMHMWEQYDICDRLMEREESEPYRGKVMRITREGESFALITE